MISDSNNGVVLYTSPFCPFCHATRLVLAEKQIACDARDVDLTQKADFPQLLSPYRHVPVLVDGDRRIFESAIINEYLDETRTDPPLMPSDPAERATVRFWIDFVHDRLVPAYFDLMNCEDTTRWPSLCTNFERWLLFAENRAFTGGYFGHNRLTLADYTLYPWFERLVSATRYRGASIPAACQKLADWRARIAQRDAVKDCSKAEKDYIAFFDKYYDAIC